jgi:hypothetical protein
MRRGTPIAARPLSTGAYAANSFNPSRFQVYPPTIPPAASTRRISVKAACRSGMKWSTSAEATTSKAPSGNGIAAASPTSNWKLGKCCRA